MTATNSIRVGLLAAAALAALTPVSFQQGGGFASATAICATCCPQAGATCVVCGTQSCTAETGYYHGKTGPGGCLNDT